MKNDAPKTQTKPKGKQIDEPPKPPTKVTLDLMDESQPLPSNEIALAEIASVLTLAMQTLCDLIILNGGGRRLKRESLEQSLDRNIVLLGKILPTAEGELLKMLEGSLRDLRDYRLRFPREDASNRKQAGEAEKILRDFRDGGHP